MTNPPVSPKINLPPIANPNTGATSLSLKSVKILGVLANSASNTLKFLDNVFKDSSQRFERETQRLVAEHQLNLQKKIFWAQFIAAIAKGASQKLAVAGSDKEKKKNKNNANNRNPLGNLDIG